MFALVMSRNSERVRSTAAVPALGEEPRFETGDAVAILERHTIGHYRVPLYVRGKHGFVAKVIRRRFVNNEAEGFGLNAGQRGFYYRIRIPLAHLWPDYAGPTSDELYIEVFETTLAVQSLPSSTAV